MHHIVREKREIDGQLVPLTKEEQKDTLKEAMKVVLDGLHDEDTHIGLYTHIASLLHSY